MIYLIVVLTYVFSNQFYAQSNEDIELELVRRFEKTQVKFTDEKTEPSKLIDENLIFVNDLIRHLTTEPELAHYHFKALIDKGLKINKSPDHNFLIYSWTMNLGEKQNHFFNIIQFKHKKTYRVFTNIEANYEGNNIIDIFQTHLKDRDYYLPYSQGVIFQKTMQVVNNYYISDTGLETDKELFSINGEKDEALTIFYQRSATSAHYENPIKYIEFDSKTNSFTVPLINPQSFEVKNETVQYYFNGKVFLIKPDFHSIEDDLFTHFSQMVYRQNSPFSEERDANIRIENDIFKAKLIYYTSKYPGSIDYSFDRLIDEGLVVKTSKDGKFKNYSWSNNITSKLFSNDWNVCQYSYEGVSVAFSDQSGDVLEIFSSRNNDTENYFVLYHYNGMGGTKTRYQKLNVYQVHAGNFSIPDLFGLPSDNKYSSGDGILVPYDYNTIIEDEEQPIHRLIKYDSLNGIFSVQQTDNNTFKTIDKYIKYKYDGYNFKKVK